MKDQDQFLLLSTPRSGSDWLVKCLGWEGSKAYLREFFNPICNIKHESKLRQVFGSEVDWVNIAVHSKYQRDPARPTYDATWCQEKHLKYDKEVWSAFKIEFLNQHFNCFSLIGYRKNMFPGDSKMEATNYWWLRYYESLIFNENLLDDDIKALVAHSRGEDLGLYNKLCAAQIIATYQTVKECVSCGVPVIEHRLLYGFDSIERTVEYLKDKIPEKLMPVEVAKQIFDTKKDTNKGDDYTKLGAEHFCLELIAMIPEEYRQYF